MGIEVAIIGAIAALSSAAGTGLKFFQAGQAKKQRRKNTDQLAGIQAQQQALLDEAKNREGTEDKEQKTLLGDKKVRDRQRRIRGQSQGRQGTIKTSPLGVPGEPETANKTLLGS